MANCPSATGFEYTLHLPKCNWKCEVISFSTPNDLVSQLERKLKERWLARYPIWFTKLTLLPPQLKVTFILSVWKIKNGKTVKYMYKSAKLFDRHSRQIYIIRGFGFLGGLVFDCFSFSDSDVETKNGSGRILDALLLDFVSGIFCSKCYLFLFITASPTLPTKIWYLPTYYASCDHAGRIQNITFLPGPSSEYTVIEVHLQPLKK